jgi:MFS transporter, PAT family, beta-lactamase induction signal transducer AmpG
MTFQRTQTEPVTVLFLVLPYGISSGFASVTLPFLLIQHGFSVATAASVTALGLSANIWRFIWAPLTDLTLSLHEWYLIGISFCAAMLLLLCFLPFNNNSTGVLSVIVLLSQIAATFVVAPVGGFMAKTVVSAKKGRAGGWYQAGNLGGMGIGGGAGIWLSSHFSYQTAGIILSIAMLGCAAALKFVPQVYAERERTLKQGFKAIVLDVKNLCRSPIVVFTTVMIVTPIGIGAAAYVWSSVSNDWKVTTNTVALVTGILSGGISAIGCVFGGWVADKIGRWWAFFGSGTLMAIVTLMMGISAFTPTAYVSGVLFYAFMFGFANAAFSAIVLHAIGKGLASTKYALLSSISNIAPVYMTTFDGWIHDKYNIKTMRLGETVVGFGFVVMSLFALSRVNVENKDIVGNSLQN